MVSTDTQERLPNKTYAPWDDGTVQALNHHQEHGRFHPFTCPGNHACETRLVAQPDGWHCPRHYCGYTQNWAWTFMARDNHSER
jgi:hypothetical protein